MDFDELLDEVVEEFGSKKGQTHESAQPEETGSVDAGRAGDRVEGESSKTTSGRTEQSRSTTAQQETLGSTRKEGPGLEGTDQSKVRMSERNAEDNVDEGVTWHPIGEMPVKTPKRRVNLTNARRRDIKSQDMSGVFGFGLDKYATHRQAAHDVLNATTTKKPRWAVTGCVLLRDQGICQICGDYVGYKFEVVQVTPNKVGGCFNEPNCLTLCGECSTCWRTSYTPKFLKGGMTELGIVKQKLSVLRRRTEEFHGCKTLGPRGVLIRRVLMLKQEDMESDLTVEGRKTLGRVLNMPDVQS